MGIAVGIDLVHVPRMARTAQRPSFLDRSFTAREQATCAGDPARLAARWAAKEATMKALGVGIGEVSMTDIEVVTLGSAPALRMTGQAAALARRSGWTGWSVSLSHDGDYATAVVVALTSAARAPRRPRRRRPPRAAAR